MILNKVSAKGWDKIIIKISNWKGGMIMEKRFQYLFLLILVGFFATPCFIEAAEKYPEKPVALIRPTEPGGAGETLVRALNEIFPKYFGQSLLNVTKPGGGGAVGMMEVKKSKNDGYTIGMTWAGFLTTRSHLTDIPYSIDDFEYIIGVASSPIIALALPQSPYNSIKDVVEAAKKLPGGKITYGTPAIGSYHHLGTEQIAMKYGIKLSHVPFKGSAETLSNLLGGHVDFALLLGPEAIPHIRDRKVKGISVYSKERYPKIPDVLTAKEQGIDIDHSLFTLLFAPKETPRDRVSMLHSAFKKTIEDSEFIALAKKLEIDIKYMSGEEVHQELKRQYLEYGEIIKALKIGKYKEK